MPSLHERGFLLKNLAWYFLLLNNSPVSALPAPQEATPTPEPTPEPVTSVITSDGQPITEVFTPTSISISGLVPPITEATIVTTTDEAGTTVAVAIAAGAGVVGAGALAAWLFEPVPGGPPPPTEPPTYTTSEQEDPPEPTEEPETTTATTTTAPPAACPFTPVDPVADFTSMPDPPKWTAEIPTNSVSSIAPECTPQGNNDQLLRAAEPGYIQELAEIFCKTDLSQDQTQSIGKVDLPDGSIYKAYNYDGVNIQFDFDFEMTNDACPQNCVDAYNILTSRCQYNSHILYGGASLEQGCGKYSLAVDAEPLTTLTCAYTDGDYGFDDIIYREEAIGAINQFCYAQNGKVLKQRDESSYIKETTFSAVYMDDCTGDGEYEITEDRCKKYLMMALDECDTETKAYKHGGTVYDDECGSFTLRPKGYNRIQCYPDNDEFVSDISHVQVTRDMAEDAINAFCDREGDGQQYTIDPNVLPPGPDVNIDDDCKTEGLAECGYHYYNDGTRGDHDGDIFLRMKAYFVDSAGDDYPCAPKQKYEIHGDRCKDNLRQLIGSEPMGSCLGSDANKLDLGTLWESSEKGCVVWNMWAVSTR